MSEPKPRLYQGESVHEQFCRMDAHYPVRETRPAEAPAQFPNGQDLQLPATFSFSGEEKSSEEFLSDTDTSALLVLVNGTIAYERYFLSGGVNVPWTSWSVAKSFVSAMIGIAIDRGEIGSIDDSADRYVPELKDSGYAGVSLRHILQMSSGADWNEDYSDPESDVNRLGPVMGGHGSLQQFVCGIRSATDPGTVCQYNSADTQVLGLVLSAATGTTLTQYMQTHLCDPLGFEHRGFWLLDAEGVEMALGGLNLSARDFAKLGELYRKQGNWQGQQIVPEPWVEATTQSDALHLQQGHVLVGGHVFPLGYGYQWWVPAGDEGEYSAIGVYNQFVYVNPVRRSVIVKLSANRMYGTTPDEHTNREEETVAFLRAINRSLPPQP